MNTYTEDHLVEQPAIQLMQHELGWDVVNCYGEWALLRPAQRHYEGQDGGAIEGAVEHQRKESMSEIYNIYCDESCHLENDGQKSMVLGAISCPKDKAREIAVRLRELKLEWGMSRHMEVKWCSVAPAKLDFYRHWLDYFFDDDDLSFRALVIPRKAELDHGSYSQSHDDWYWKMYFDMLKAVLREDRRYRIFLDIKDTLGGKRVAKLHDVLCNNLYDFDREIVSSVQLVHSHEIEEMQLTDLLIGALSYQARGLNTSPAKLALIQRFKERSKLSLERSTLLGAKKVNLLFWQPNFPKD